MTARVLLAFFYLILLVGCFGSTSSEILGVWHHGALDQTIEFFEDGSVQISSDNEELAPYVTAAGRYSFPDETHILFEFGGAGAQNASIWSFELNQDRLTVASPNNEANIYTRDRSEAIAMRQLLAHQSSVREQVEEGLKMAGGARAAISVYFFDNKDKHEFPETNRVAGIAEPVGIQSDYVKSVTIENGSIIVTYGNNADKVISGRSIILSPVDHWQDASQDDASWRCSSSTIDAEYLPDSGGWKVTPCQYE